MGENIKQIVKGILKRILKRAILGVVIILSIVILLASASYIMTLDDAKKEEKKSSTPYSASTYTNGISVEKDGKLKSSTTVNELWEEMEYKGSRVGKYLDSPKELARLMKAEIVTKYPDTRKNPDEKIKWQDIVDNEDELQGIIKFKRAGSEGNTPETMTYVDPETFQGYIDEYNGTGSETAKKNALTHFTLRKAAISNSRSTIKGSSGNAVDESKLYFIGDSWIVGLQSSGIAKTSYFYGQTGKHAGSPEMDISNIPERSDASAIVLYLGVNDPSTSSKMNNLIDKLVSKYSGKPIYVLEVSPVNPDKYKGAVTNDQIKQYNEAVKKHCDETENVVFLSVASNVTDNNGKLTNTNDGLHLNNYKDWYDGIISEIKTNSVYTDEEEDSEEEVVSDNEDEVSKDQEETKSDSNDDSDDSDDSDDVEKAVEITEEGDGYHKKYVSSAGITYTCYKQYEGSYSTQPYWDGTIASDGCGPTSVAILTSGLRDSTITPADTAADMKAKYRIYKLFKFKR